MNARTGFHLAGIILAMVLLLSCAIISTPQATASPTTALPTNTAEPSETLTALPLTNTPEPIDDEAEPAIMNTPISEWNDIPIMKGAYNTQADEASIIFYIETSVEDVYTYYVSIMKESGFSLFADSEGGEGHFTMFEKNGVLITIAIASNPADEDITLVVISKQ